MLPMCVIAHSLQPLRCLSFPMIIFAGRETNESFCYMGDEWCIHRLCRLGIDGVHYRQFSDVFIFRGGLTPNEFWGGCAVVPLTYNGVDYGMVS